MQLVQGDKMEDLQNGYSIIQNTNYFCFGTDAILLAHFADVNDGERVVDFCTGCGIIPILLCAKTSNADVMGIEIQPELADMAERSVKINKLEERVRVICGDIKEVRQYVEYGVDAVVVNPPYEKVDAGKSNKNSYVNIAKREVKCTLEDVVAAAARVLRTGGRLYMIYRTQRFAELMERLRHHKLEPKRVMLVTQQQGKAPNFALVEARKGAKEGVEFLPTLIVYEADGTYTEPLKRIYHLEEEDECCIL